jgi:hypothetical protein
MCIIPEGKHWGSPELYPRLQDSTSYEAYNYIGYFAAKMKVINVENQLTGDLSIYILH